MLYLQAVSGIDLLSAQYLISCICELSFTYALFPVMYSVSVERPPLVYLYCTLLSTYKVIPRTYSCHGRPISKHRLTRGLNHSSMWGILYLRAIFRNAPIYQRGVSTNQTVICFTYALLQHRPRCQCNSSRGLLYLYNMLYLRAV